jgi:hypothetical protein
VRPLPQTKLRGITIPFGINTKEKKYQDVVMLFSEAV